ncbi:aldo/keto reductase [Sulfitobacter aestuariivivens]|uniref:Aldo/keto reductase n=1 Tax=Sulfitobacter aestuariivivens TaxID=2766981 RepID=A0A927D4H7_9RHOB|nr:aldo/keto reductase [Sulfitobacter aestuariivivens]MBD3664093.1 aldo/keto reductase [Sulfitobacter aestuariivivens]
MATQAARPERTEIAPGMSICRVLTGLWQVADIERDGTTIDPDAGADALQSYVDAGFDTFDMADHYGSAEILTGRLLSRGPDPKPLAFTKWVPTPGPLDEDTIRAGVQARLDRLGTDRVDLLQFHGWDYLDDTLLESLHALSRLREEGLIAELGVTNFDAAHFNLALSDGVPLRTNQVSFSLIDRRAAGDMATVCAKHGAHVLAYGTLCGGFLSDRWVDQPEPAEITDWSKMKYKRFIDAAGGWDALQAILKAAKTVATKHDVSVSNVATRWVLDQPQVAGVIIGARLGGNMHADDNLKLFSFTLDAEDRACLEAGFQATQPIPGDCGDEYRKPPFLTASGDLSDHLSEMPPAQTAHPVPGRPAETRVLTGSKWEDIAGYCRARRIGDRILVAGTTAVSGHNRAVAPDDAGAQTVYILDRIIAAIEALGGCAEDVVRTRVYITDEADVVDISEAHGRVFRDIKPVNTLYRIAGLIDAHKVEIDVEAIVREG